MSSSHIGKDQAKKIAAKLGGVVTTLRNAHDRVEIFHDGRLIADFGLRRSSKMDIGHAHIPRELHISPRFAAELARCTRTKQDWLDLMKSKGLLPASD